MLFASGDSGIWGLKKNFALLELLEKLQFSPQATPRPSSFSEESLAKEKEVWCSFSCSWLENSLILLI